MERSPAVQHVRIRLKVWILPALIEQRREVRRELGAEEISIARAPRKRETQHAAERGALVGARAVRSLVAAAAPDRQPTRFRDRLDQGGLPRAILTDKERHRLGEFELEIANERNAVGKLVEIRHALGQARDALQE